MNKKYQVIHTYRDIEATAINCRPVWKSIVKEVNTWGEAYDSMLNDFRAYITLDLIAATIHHDCAEIETAERENTPAGSHIFTIVHIEGD